MAEKSFSANISEMDAVLNFVGDELTANDCPAKALLSVNVAIDEIFTNIFSYAYPKSRGEAIVTVNVADKCAVISFSDNGIPYNPLERPDPDVTLSAEERKIGGLGIFMVKKMMDKVEYEYRDSRNILTIYKKFD